MTCLYIIFFVLIQVREHLGISIKNEKTGATELCLVNEFNKVTEEVDVSSKEKCHKFCEMTENCRYWTWYRRHCDRLPCMGDHLTKENVCYLLSSCGQIVAHKCGEAGCWSGSRWGEVRLSNEMADLAAQKIIHDMREDMREEL